MAEPIQYDPEQGDMDMSSGPDDTADENAGLSQADMERAFAELAKPVTERQQQQEKKFDETQVEVDGIDRTLTDAEDQLLLPQDAQYHDRDQDFSVDPPHESFTVAVEVGNNPDYIGLLYNTGCIRTDGTITKTQAVAADGYVTLAHYDSSALAGSYGNMTGSYPPMTCIAGITLDAEGLGHVTAINTFDITDYFYTESEINGLLAAQTYIGLNDTSDANYVGKNGYVPMVDEAGVQLTLTSFAGLYVAGGWASMQIVVPKVLGGPLHYVQVVGIDQGEA